MWKTATGKLIALGDPELKLNQSGVETLYSQPTPLSLRLATQFWEQTFDRWSKPENSIKNEAAVWIHPFEDVLRSGLADTGKPAAKISLEGRLDWNALQTPAVNNAQPAPRTQSKGGLLQFEAAKTTVVLYDPNRLTLPWLGRRLGLAALNVFGARSFGSRSAPPRIDEKRFDRLVIPPAQTRGASSGSPGVKLFFVDTGQSSGTSVTMTIVNEGTKPVTVVGGAFVLEPVLGLSERDVAREIQRLKSRKSMTVTIDAYCLNMKKAPPAAAW